MKLRWVGRVCLAAAVVMAAGGVFRQSEAQGDVRAGASKGGDWANWRGPKGDGVSSESGWTTKWPKDGPKRLWRAEVGDGYSAISVAGGRAYTLGNSGGKDTVFCFDAASGDVLWKSKKVKAGYSTPAVFSRGARQLLASFNASGLVILDLKNGRSLMTHPWKTAYGVNSTTPIVSDGNVFLSSGYKTGCALVDVSGKKAKQLWRNKNMSNHCNSSVLHEGYLYGFNGNVGGGGALICLDVSGK